MNGKTFSYEYDPNGIRYKKTVDGTTTEYYLADDQIMAENRGTNLIVYIYDAMGIAGMIYNGAYYLYERNALGDVYRIRDANGTEVAYYEYDAWGNITTKTGTMADINPFRYRGYYYDTETGFYYLQTRYYDPETRLFINADDYEILGTLASTLGQLNLYTYCNNNPIMYTDKSGEGILSAVLLGAIIGAGVGAVSYALSEVASFAMTGEWSGTWGGFLGSVAGGALSGMLTVLASGIGVNLIAGISSIVSSAVGMSLENAFGEDTHSTREIVGNSLMSGVISAVVAGFIPKIPGLNSGRGSYSAIYSQIMTKLKNDTISKVSLRTFSKMFVFVLYEELMGEFFGVASKI